ncbi:MAG: nucleotidyl transferase AbiEii/AbiGii toxin family protein [Peptostreptococcaceae bacterium]|nr:nucleotidyl transferase AbiEii/AbiGii toxin family protein [Peptostreptococcaceae bacterium]
MKTPEQLKGTIRNISKKKGLHSQEILQMFLFERVLERLAKSEYKNNFILKGGLLISDMIGISERTTMDMDTTIRGLQMEEDAIEDVVKEIISIDVGDEILFKLQKIEPIHEKDAYNNFRIHFNAIYGKMNVPMKIDITTGDIITPSAIEYSYQMMFEDRTISIMAYTLETILAEKYETIIRRNIGNTRARDYYDLYTLFKIRRDKIRKPLFKLAVESTSKKRNSEELLREWKDICTEIRKENALRNLWGNYIKDNKYAKNLNFDVVAENVLEVAKYLNEE